MAGTADAEPSGNYRWRLFPAADFYPHYIADPIRAQSALMVMTLPETEIPESGRRRYSLRLGGRFSILRCHPRGEPDRGWQLDFEGGFFGHFDMEHSLDNIGWDGIMGLLVSYKPNPDFGIRFGSLHDSAHVGDEYTERIGRGRIGYTREEMTLGLSWRVSTRWRLYLEGGSNYSPKPFQERLRGQAGAEYFGTRRWFNRAGWYAALDIQAYEENDWGPRFTGQVGVMIPTGRGTGRYRIALEIAHGRSVLGEFYLRDETFIALGWYFDF